MATLIVFTLSGLLSHSTRKSGLPDIKWFHSLAFFSMLKKIVPFYTCLNKICEKSTTFLSNFMIGFGYLSKFNLKLAF